VLLCGSTGAGLLGAGCGDDGTAGPPMEPFSFEPAPGGVRQLTTSQIQYSVEYLLGSDAASAVQLWRDPQLLGLESIAANELAISASNVDMLETVLPIGIDVSLEDPSHVGAFAPCVMQSPTPECYDEVATRFGRVAWRRPVEDDERARLVAIAKAAQDWGSGDFDVGLRYELSAILQSPNFLYVVEVGQGSGPRRTLAPTELASRMSLFLLHRTPDVELLDAADAGELDSSEGVRAQARRLLALPEAKRSVDRFYAELYTIRELSNVSKDPALYPEWNAELAASMQEEMLRFIDDIVWTRDADARELFTSNTTFVDARLALLYQVAPPATGWKTVTFPEGEGRGGLLGQAGYMARLSHPDRTSPTRRGKFFWEALMCEPLGSPPPGVNTTIPPEEPNKPRTMREKLEAHKANGSCASCHDKLDSIGLSMEHFDAIGRYREDDRGLTLDTHGDYGDLGEFDSPASLGKILGESDDAMACIVKSFWRQSMGHVETEGEADSLDALTERFEGGGYSIQSMLVELCANPAFRTVNEPK
jgi:hypothetical protein